MSAPHEAVEIVRQWIEKAEHDLKNAEHTLQMGADCPLDTVCFHAQQRVEKYLKAMLTERGIGFPRTHDLGELLARLPFEVRSELNLNEVVELNPYAVEARYPGEWEPLTREETIRAVEISRRVLSVVRRHLSPEALAQS
jgi:HEPN domain-containing protein